MKNRKTREMFLVSMFGVLLILLPCMSQAEIPGKINYQGYLTSAAGVPVNGTVQIIFSIYDVSSGGSALWTETRNITVTRGVYNVNLGDVAPITLPFDVPYYVGVKVGADPEMTPRSSLTSVPYAITANYALSAPPTWHQILPAAQRFVVVMNSQAVLDKETGLVWEKSPSMISVIWIDAQSYCNNLTLGNRLGWRLPTVQELASLVDPTVYPITPTLPSGHPFTNVQSAFYWATTHVSNPALARVVNFNYGYAGLNSKSDSLFYWCTRGGQGVDPQ
jgi:hypothetical protein